MELLILKSGDRYVRVTEGEYLLVQLAKASVFPMEQLDVVRDHELGLVAAGFTGVAVRKLVLTEEDFLS